MSFDHYAVLGVKKTATQAEIKAAHIAAVKLVHPDKPGGSQVAFERVQMAYETLSDPKRRRHYDRTGQSQDASNAQMDAALLEAMNRIMAQFLNDGIDLAKVDVPQLIRSGLDQTIITISADLAKVERRLKKLDTLERRFKPKQGKGSRSGDAARDRALFDMVIRGQRQMLVAEQVRVERALRLHERVKEVFDRFDYDFDLPVARQTTAQRMGAYQVWPT